VSAPYVRGRHLNDQQKTFCPRFAADPRARSPYFFEEEIANKRSTQTSKTRNGPIPRRDGIEDYLAHRLFGADGSTHINI